MKIGSRAEDALVTEVAKLRAEALGQDVFALLAQIPGVRDAVLSLNAKKGAATRKRRKAAVPKAGPIVVPPVKPKPQTQRERNIRALAIGLRVPDAVAERELESTIVSPKKAEFVYRFGGQPTCTKSEWRALRTGAPPKGKKYLLCLAMLPDGLVGGILLLRLADLARCIERGAVRFSEERGGAFYAMDPASIPPHCIAYMSKGWGKTKPADLQAKHRQTTIGERLDRATVPVLQPSA